MIDFTDITRALAHAVWLLRGGWWWRYLTPEEIGMFSGEDGFPLGPHEMMADP